MLTSLILVKAHRKQAAQTTTAAIEFKDEEKGTKFSLNNFENKQKVVAPSLWCSW